MRDMFEYELTNDDIKDVREYINTHRGTIYVFGPSGSRKSEEYIEWLHVMYPNCCFEYISTMLSHSLLSKVTSYLLTKWRYRDIDMDSVIQELESLKEEIAPLRKLKERYIAFKAAKKLLERF